MNDTEAAALALIDAAGQVVDGGLRAFAAHGVPPTAAAAALLACSTAALRAAAGPDEAARLLRHAADQAGLAAKPAGRA